MRSDDYGVASGKLAFGEYYNRSGRQTARARKSNVTEARITLVFLVGIILKEKTARLERSDGLNDYKLLDISSFIPVPL